MTAPRYVLTENIVIPAGTMLEACDDLGAGGLRAFGGDRGCVQLFVGRRAALAEGMVAARPALRLVDASDHG